MTEPNPEKTFRSIHHVSTLPYCMWTVMYTAIITLLVLVTVHHLYNYLKSNLTTPVTNDLVSYHEKKIAEMKEGTPELEGLLQHFKKST